MNSIELEWCQDEKGLMGFFEELKERTQNDEEPLKANADNVDQALYHMENYDFYAIPLNEKEKKVFNKVFQESSSETRLMDYNDLEKFLKGVEKTLDEFVENQLEPNESNIF